MRNSKLLQGGEIPLFHESTSETIRAAQERMYIMSNLTELKEKYREYIYEELILQNSDIENHYLDDRTAVFGKQTALAIIESNIRILDVFFVLSDPTNGDPCVVEEIESFLPGAPQSPELKQLMDYANTVNTRRSAFLETANEISKDIAKRAGKRAASEALGMASDRLMSRGDKLSEIARHTASGHATTMRVNRSIRGKLAQQKAFGSLFRKSDMYAKYAIRNKATGMILGKMATKMKGGTFRPIAPMDALRPMKFADGSLGGAETSRMTDIIIRELSKYCTKNNNFQRIMHQQYFEQG